MFNKTSIYLMKNEKGLAELIEKVKESSRQMGEPLTQNDIADRLGRNKSYLSGLKRGYENVSPQFVALFKQTFKKYLPPEEVDYDVGVVIKQIYTMNLVILDAIAEIIAEQQHQTVAEVRAELEQMISQYQAKL